MATDLPGILIVDDNEDNRYTLQLMLESDGHEPITCATGGNEALALIGKEKFSLVLLDLMMPDLNGDEVLKVIKSDPDKRDIPVVMISADTDAEKVSQCIELGADDYLPKPFNPTILRARIAAALRRHSLRALENEYLGKIENEKRHSENLLRNILPAEIATRLRNGESNIADHFDDATVIFADVVGFGKITARMKAPDGGEIRPRHGCCHRAIAIAAAGPVSDPGGTAFRPRDGGGHRHAPVRLRCLGRYRQHRRAPGGGESAQSRARVRGDGEKAGK